MAEPPTPDRVWFAVRCVTHHPKFGVYEERITLWNAASPEAAIALAEDEARDYAQSLESVTYIGLAQSYALSDEPGSGAEIFSLMRESELPPKDYLDRFFDSGTERQGHL